MRGLLPIVLLGILSLAVAGCHEVGDVKVLSLSFDGTKAFDSAALRRILATRQSGWLPWSAKHYFDRAEFESDLKRITAFYADRGFPDARISGVKITFNEAKDGVRLNIAIDEGKPVLVESVNYEGFEDLPAPVRAALQSMPLKQGDRRDRDVVRRTRDQAMGLFRDNGYPLAVIDAGERPGATDDAVIVTYRADAGERMTFGDVTVSGLEQVRDVVVVRELAFAPGDLFDERKIAQSQRRLGGLELFDVTVITPRFDEAVRASVPVAVTVSEGKPRRLRLGAGYGSEELGRATVSWQHLNFMGGAKQASVDGKWSAIDRGIDVSLVDPHAWRTGFSSRLSASTWKTEQLTYDSESLGATAGLAFQTERGPSGRQPVQYRTRLTYSFERLRYGIKPEFLADQSRRDERIALGLDPDTGRASGRLATAQFDFERYALDNIANPRLGTATSVHVEFASPAFGGTYQYAEVGGDVRAFAPIGPLVIAGRAHASTILAADPLGVPFAKRYFLGGSNSLRGWSRYEVSPLDEEGRPIGGRSVLDFSGELRIPLPRPAALSLVVFTDAGNVWSDGGSIANTNLRWDAGVGLRYLTPIGALRLDLAHQLTAIPGLFVNGHPSTRAWRVHFNIGHSF